MSSSVKPKVVLVHGGWHRESMYNVLKKYLHGIEVHTVQNPSSAPVPPAQLGGLYDDARNIRQKVESLDGPVVVVAHSYGGAPTTEGLVGLEDKVKRILYLNAFVPDLGASLLGVLGGPDWFYGLDHVDEGYFEMLHAERVFYNDFDPLAAEMAAADLGPQSVKSYDEKITQVAWHTIPSSYVIGEQDAAVPREASEFMASRTKKTYRLPGGHSPFLKQPDRVAMIIHEELKLAMDS
ncbi:alpha/beta hydrolase [Micromonospora musae]|uniref:alpha/beta hydrolase n=1 Tax=Micromonospora musae TaxID=1894970 RepID=UPI0033E3869A